MIGAPAMQRPPGSVGAQPAGPMMNGNGLVPWRENMQVPPGSRIFQTADGRRYVQLHGGGPGAQPQDPMHHPGMPQPQPQPVAPGFPTNGPTPSHPNGPMMNQPQTRYQHPTPHPSVPPNIPTSLANAYMPPTPAPQPTQPLSPNPPPAATNPNTGSPTRRPGPAGSGPLTPDEIKEVDKCRRFLRNLMMLASQNFRDDPEGQQIESNIKALVKQLVDNQITPLNFTEQVKVHLRSETTQPALVPFLEATIPLLRRQQENRANGMGRQQPAVRPPPPGHQYRNVRAPDGTIKTVMVRMATPRGPPPQQPTRQPQPTPATPMYVPTTNTQSADQIAGTTAFSRQPAAVHQPVRSMAPSGPTPSHPIHQQRAPTIKQEPGIQSHGPPENMRMPHPSHPMYRPASRMPGPDERMIRTRMPPPTGPGPSHSGYPGVVRVPMRPTPASNSSPGPRHSHPSPRQPVVQQKDHDDELDIIGLAGVDLQNESSQLLAASEKLIVGELPNSGDSHLISSEALRIRVANISQHHRNPSEVYPISNPYRSSSKASSSTRPPLRIASEALQMLSWGIEYHLRDIVEKVVLTSQHRAKQLQNDPYHKPTTNVREQLRVVQEIEQSEKRRSHDQKAEQLAMWTKKRPKGDNPEDDERRQMAKTFQENEKQKRHNERMTEMANQTLLSNRQKRPAPAKSKQPKKKPLRVSQRDALYVLEDDPNVNSEILYMACLKFN